MESPNQYLSPEACIARIAPTSFESQGSKVCSTIRPLPLRHCFAWFQRNHVWKISNQYLSPEPSFSRIDPTSFEIQGSKVCSTIRPLPLHHCFGWFQRNHVRKAPTSTFHQKLELPGLLQPVSRTKGPKCARLSAASLCATVLLGLKGTMYGKPQPVPFTRSLNC